MPVVIKRYDSCCTTEFVWKNSDKMQIRKNMVGTIAKEWKKVTKKLFPIKNYRCVGTNILV